MSSIFATTVLRSGILPSLAHLGRTFTTTSRNRTSLYDLRARAVSRENNWFSKASGISHIEHSPALQLLRAESRLAEGQGEVDQQQLNSTTERPKVLSSAFPSSSVPVASQAMKIKSKTSPSPEVSPFENKLQHYPEPSETDLNERRIGRFLFHKHSRDIEWREKKMKSLQHDNALHLKAIKLKDKRLEELEDKRKADRNNTRSDLLTGWALIGMALTLYEVFRFGKWFWLDERPTMAKQITIQEDQGALEEAKSESLVEERISLEEERVAAIPNRRNWLSWMWKAS